MRREIFCCAIVILVVYGSLVEVTKSEIDEGIGKYTLLFLLHIHPSEYSYLQIHSNCDKSYLFPSRHCLKAGYYNNRLIYMRPVHTISSKSVARLASTYLVQSKQCVTGRTMHIGSNIWKS